MVPVVTMLGGQVMNGSMQLQSQLERAMARVYAAPADARLADASATDRTDRRDADADRMA